MFCFFFLSEPSTATSFASLLGTARPHLEYRGLLSGRLWTRWPPEVWMVRLCTHCFSWLSFPGSPPVLTAATRHCCSTRGSTDYWRPETVGSNFLSAEVLMSHISGSSSPRKQLGTGRISWRHGLPLLQGDSTSFSSWSNASGKLSNAFLPQQAQRFHTHVQMHFLIWWEVLCQSCWTFGSLSAIRKFYSTVTFNTVTRLPLVKKQIGFPNCMRYLATSSCPPNPKHIGN